MRTTYDGAVAASPPLLRVGLIGAGRWAAVHRDALPRGGATLVAVATGTEASAERVRREWGVLATSDVGAFLGEALDAVIIASPNAFHASHARAVLASGRHVLVEKPMATTVREARDIADAASCHPELVVAVGHEMRVFTLFERIKRLLDGGSIGRPVHLALSLWRRPYRTGAGGWKSDPTLLGSTILEEPIHYLDLARWYLGTPTTVAAWATSRPGREALWEQLDVRLEFASGAAAILTRSIAAYGHAVDLKLVGTRGALHAWWRGSMDLDPEPEVGLIVHDDVMTRRVDVDPRTGHAFDVWRQTAAFVGAIRSGARPPADADDGRIAVELCLAVERALVEGRVLNVDLEHG
jgi:myo-inositol 2-dehydrogenase / D-chiro-inositol 1-dehydrogenase